MKRGLKLFTVVKLGVGMVVAASLLLAGCGGGSGGSGGSAPAASTLSGVAAVGAPIVAGTINISCAAGSALAPTTTSSMGAWQVTLSGQTLPCAVQVSGGTINAVANTLLYHSIATAPGTVNVTPLTELMVANLAGTATPSIWFAGLNATPTQLTVITQTQVNTALTNLRTALGGLTPLGTINPITTAFTPTAGNASDDMLVALKTAMTNTGVTYAALLSNASMPSFTPPVSGFDTALTTAYAGMTPISLVGVTANGVTLGGNLIAPVTDGSHTYYYWDASGNGTSAGTDAVTHDRLDKIFNGGTLGDSAKDTTDTTAIVTLSNGTRIHLLTQAELSALYTARGVPSGWASSTYYWSATQADIGSIVARPDFHNAVDLSNNAVLMVDDTAPFYVAFEVLGAAAGGGSTTPATTSRAYVVSSGGNDVAVIDTTSNTRIATVAVGSSPYGVAVNSTTNRAYVTNFGSNTVSVIDTTSNTVVATVVVGAGPWGVAVHPAANRAYVANSNSLTVSVIDTTNNTVVATVAVGSRPEGVAVNSTTNRAYVTNFGSNTVSVIDTTSNTVVATIPVGFGPGGVAVHPAANRAYVANFDGNNVSVIDTTNNTVVATVRVGGEPWGVAVHPTSNRVYVTNSRTGSTGDNTVSVIDTTSNTVVATVGVGLGPYDVAVNSITNRAYVTAAYDSTVSIIDTITNTVISTWTWVGGSLYGVAVVP